MLTFCIFFTAVYIECKSLQQRSTVVTASLTAKKKSRSFQNVFTVRTSRLKSAYLIRIIVVFGVIALLPLIVWHIVYPVEVYDIMISAETYCWLCVYPHAPADWLHLNVAQLVVLIWGAVLVVLAALLAFKVNYTNGQKLPVIALTFNNNI